MFYIYLYNLQQGPDQAVLSQLPEPPRCFHRRQGAEIHKINENCPCSPVNYSCMPLFLVPSFFPTYPILPFFLSSSFLFPSLPPFLPSILPPSLPPSPHQVVFLSLVTVELVSLIVLLTCTIKIWLIHHAL